MLEDLYRALYRIRHVEQRVREIYPSDKIKSPVHLSIGQEGAAVGVCQALLPADVVFGTYRGHALYLAKGGDLKAMMAELYGKSTGCAKGKGGSMHLVDVGAGFMGTSAVVGTGIPQAVGYAYALKLRNQARVVAVFFGDGAVEEGVFHESLNFAALKKLPVLFVCENNFYSIHTPLSRRQTSTDIATRMAAYEIPTQRIDDGDVGATVDAARSMVASIRRGQGPAFLECCVYRWMEHVGPGEDFHFGYRKRAEAEPWMERDPVAKTGRGLPPAVREDIERDVHREVQEAIADAEAAAFPAAQELFTHVYKES